MDPGVNLSFVVAVQAIGVGERINSGKLAMDVGALPVKEMSLGEVRQIVASAFKLAHGAPLGRITWT